MSDLYPTPWRGHKTGEYFNTPLREEVWQLLDAKRQIVVPYLTEQECSIIVAAVNGEAQAHEEIDKLSNRIVDLAQERAELEQALDSLETVARSYSRYELGEEPGYDRQDLLAYCADSRALLERIGGRVKGSEGFFHYFLYRKNDTKMI